VVVDILTSGVLLSFGVSSVIGVSPVDVSSVGVSSVDVVPSVDVTVESVGMMGVTVGLSVTGGLGSVDVEIHLIGGVLLFTF